MLLKRWEELPEEMQIPQVRKYYDILSKKKTSLVLKRAFDITAASAMLIALSPVFAALAVAIKADSEGPVFFRQERVTQYGRKFRIHKFRSMVQGADKGSQITVSNDSRVTKTGEFIRKFKLDEISQLLDVLSGDMTFVGTRPEIQKYVDQYTDEMKATLLLPAGITSTASVCYKDESSLLDSSTDTEKTYTQEVLPDKMRYNLRDIEEFSFINDIKIMFMTAFAMLGKDFTDKKSAGEKTEKKKPLIALLTNNDDDIYCFRKELIEALISENYDVLISCPDGEKFRLLSDLKYIYDDPFIDRRGTNPINDSKLFIHYLKLFRKYKPDVVLTYTAKPNVYGSIAAHILKIPVINNVTGFGSVLNKGDIMQKFIMQLFKAAYRKSECVMFQNETNMSLAEKTGMVKGKRKLIPGSGVDTERFPLQPYPSGGNGIDGEKVVFNYIGRILHDKGVDDFIENAKRIKKKYPNTQFNMLGFIEQTEMHYKDELEELEKKGIVHYLGSQKDVRPFIAASHATIHPSTYGEGMSNVLLESASSGRVLITTDNPGCFETVRDGETGYIYHGGNVDELYEKTEKFLSLSSEERKLMGEKGRKYIKENFSRSIVVKAYLEEIKKLLNH